MQDIRKNESQIQLHTSLIEKKNLNTKPCHNMRLIDVAEATLKQM